MIHLRTPTLQPAAPELPSNIVWLNRGTWTLCVTLALIAIALALRALLMAPWFSISAIRLTGDTQFHNALTIKSNVLPMLTGNYFSVNLQSAQQQFEALPWIRSAVVQREFPDRLHVQLTAHRPTAKWIDSAEVNPAATSERYINAQGDVFEATETGVLDTRSLPELSGPLQASKQVLSMYQDLQKMLSSHIASVDSLTLTPQGTWRAVLSNQTTLELGSGQPQDVVARATKWLSAMPAVFQQYGARQLRSVDLRYPQGFAVQMAGITTRSER